jgi:hypothetical protein
MKTIEQKITDFSGGMTNNIRAEIANVVALSYHFNITDKKLIPKRTYLTLTDASEKISRFIYAKNETSGYAVYGLGQTATGKPKIFKSTVPVTDWTAPANGEGTVGVVAPNVFFVYKDIAYCWQGGTKLSSFDLVTTPTFTDEYQAIAYTNVAQPIHHPADDCAYFFQDNVVHKLNNVTWSASVLTLPSNLKIIGGAPYGDYLAILCSPIQAGTADTILFLWDRDSSLSTISAKINLGMGEAKHIGYDNNGIFITQFVNSISGFGGYNNALVVKYYSGGTILEKKISDDATSGYFNSIQTDLIQQSNSVSANNAFYFPTTLITTKDAVTYYFIFKVQVINGQIVLTVNQNITGVTAGQQIKGIYEVTEFWFIAHSVSVALQTLITGTFQEAAIETILYSGGDSSVKKKLIGVTVMTSPLSASGQIILEYRKDEGTTWTNIFTHDTNDSISHSAINNSSGTLPEFKEIQFRIESTGGAEITGLKFRYELLDKDVY